MTEILQVSSAQSSLLSLDDNDGLLQQATSNHFSSSSPSSLINPCSNLYSVAVSICNNNNHNHNNNNTEDREKRKRREEEQEEREVSFLDIFVTVFRKSLVGSCNSAQFQDFNCDNSLKKSSKMEIGVPTNVRHVAHVTFDRFNGFLGLPVEFEPEVPRRPPSASTSVFGVSTESMQLSFDSRGNSVPTILLMMQRRLYAQGGLQAEGIFRINGDNGQEEQIREQLNRGEVPENIDVHSLAGLIKAWFRELPNGVLDSIEPEQVMQAQSEEECARLVSLLPATEASLMNWAVNLMADVAQLENLNKMNARNIAMVFAPNMTQMADPLTALMYAVQVMNFLKTLIVKTLREREDAIVEAGPTLRFDHFDENNGPHCSFRGTVDETSEMVNKEEDQDFSVEDPTLESHENTSHNDLTSKSHSQTSVPEDGGTTIVEGGTTAIEAPKFRNPQASNLNHKKVLRKHIEKSKGSTIVSRLNSRTERIEAWR
ncbi:rho GTPase-activating protein 4-like [Rutidosis leptorrhynchoides]|uniref:rho GTPase-activating protein 4-like n=1 Tax=Rutidosis leptorrhynchoides TaxID=125765 RepID=UPI003A9A5496